MDRRRRAEEDVDLSQSAFPELSRRPALGDRRARRAQFRRELLEYHAELDQRVQRGEISRPTRRRYLVAYRRQFLPEGPASRWFRRLVLEVVLLMGLVMLIAGAVEIGPAYAAANGRGTPGYFTVLRATTCNQSSSCSWDGTFRSNNGKDIRKNVALEGTWRGVSVGTRIPALDSGDAVGLVFPRTGSEHWHEDALWLALGVVIIASYMLFLWRRLRPMRGTAVRGLMQRL